MSKIELLDRQIGKLTVVEQLEVNLWLCQCECGNQSKIRTTHLTRTVRPTRSCGCIRSSRARNMQKTICRLPQRYDTLIGNVYGKLTVVEDLGLRKTSTGSGRFWKCDCDCGGSLEIRTAYLQRKIRPTRSCGCLRREHINRVRKGIEERKPRESMVGRVFGRLTVMKKGAVIKRARTWQCKCECGKITNVITSNLLHRTCPTRSCGCVRREKAKINIHTALKSCVRTGRPRKQPSPDKNTMVAPKRSLVALKPIEDCRVRTVVDEVASPELSEWLQSEYNGMKRRCEDDNHPYYHLFGGSGIKLAWDDFEAFEEWIVEELGIKSVGTKLVRIDRYGDFEANNLRWSGS